MKKMNKKLLVLGLAICGISTFAQEKLVEQEPVPYLQKEKKGDTLSLAKLVEPKKGFIIINDTIKLKSPTIQYQEDVKDSLLFNDKMLNILFADKIGTSFGGSRDLSLQKYYASLDNSDNSISLGFNIDDRGGNELEKLTNLFSASIKMKSSDNFATVIDKDNKFLKKGLGLTLKYTRVLKGTIFFTKEQKKVVKAHRKQLRESYNKKVTEFNKEKLKKEYAEHSVKKAYLDSLKSYKKVLKKKQDDLYTEFAKEEVKLLEDYKMYNFLWSHWFSTEVFIPVGEEEYEISPDSLVTIKDKKVWNFNATATYNFMLESSSKRALFFKIGGRLQNNNTVFVSDIEKTTFRKFTPVPGGFSSEETKDVYLVANYKKFVTPSLLADASYFFCPFKYGNIGVSAAIEQNFGEYNKLNWKLGIPISLKDKEGKPKVNFEIQYKEQNTLSEAVHYFGISTNFLFGKIIN